MYIRLGYKMQRILEPTDAQRGGAPMSALALIAHTSSSPISTFRLPDRCTIKIWGTFLKSGCKMPFLNSAACS
jgi:hypothetical protein